MASVGWFESALDCFSYRPTISYQIIAYPFVEDYFNIAGPFRPGLSGNLPSPFELLLLSPDRFQDPIVNAPPHARGKKRIRTVKIDQNTDSSQEVPGSEASGLSLA